jgi:flavin reductase
MLADLRGVMRHFATGVCIATIYTDGPDGRCHDAVTINSLTSVSLDPPLVSMCLRLESAFLADLLKTKRWAISILNGGDSDIAKLLAQDRPARAAVVSTLPASPGQHTAALVLDAASWLECVLWDSFDVGDHTLVVGEVVAVGIQQQRPLLIFLHGRYHVLKDTPSNHVAIRSERHDGLSMDKQMSIMSSPQGTPPSSEPAHASPVTEVLSSERNAQPLFYGKALSHIDPHFAYMDPHLVGVHC